MSIEASTLDLLDSWYRGDKEALVALIERHASWLREYVRRQMTSRMRHFEGSEDVVQTVLYNLLRYTPAFRPENEMQFRALIARAVSNRLCELHEYSIRDCRDPDRAEPLPSVASRIQIGIASAGQPDRRCAEEEERAFLLWALQLIDPEDRRLVQWRDFDGLSFSEVGARLTVSEEGARSRHRRALERLRDQVERLKKGQLQDLLSDLEAAAGARPPL